MDVNGLDVEITLDCNLKCSYCYAGVENRPKGVMSEEIINDTLDLVQKYGKPIDLKMKTGQLISATHIRFYGGEPMLHFDRIKYFVEEANKRGMTLTYTVMTNGTIMTQEIADWMKTNRVNTQRSVDGCAEAQAITRPNSIEFYDKVTEILKDYGASRRMTIVPETAHLIMQSVRELERKGFYGGFSLIPNYYVKWTKEQEDTLIKHMWELADYIIEKQKKGETMYSYQFAREAACMFGSGHTQYGCGAGKGLHCITWDGYVTLCHRFANEPRDSKFCCGTLKECLAGTERGYGQEVKDRLQEVKDEKYLEKCKTCIAQVGCEKGCYHINQTCSGDLRTPPELYCKIRQNAAKQALYADIELRHIDPFWFTRGNPRIEAKQYVAKNNIKPLIRRNNNGSGKSVREYLQGEGFSGGRSQDLNRGSGYKNNPAKEPTGVLAGNPQPNSVSGNGNTNPNTGEMRFCS